MNEKSTYGELLRAMNYKYIAGDKVVPKYKTRFPMGAERDYCRLVREYMWILRDILKETLPEIKSVYKTEVKDVMRKDEESAILVVLTAIFNKMSNKLRGKIDAFNLEVKLRKIAKRNLSLTTEQWINLVRSTLGFDIRKDYYLGEFFQRELDAWVQENVNLITNIPQDALNQMKDVVLDGYINGQTTRAMATSLMAIYNVDRKRAQFIARDQNATLYSQIAKKQQTDAGVSQYVWSSSLDERVRTSHRDFDGQTFSWDNPPEGYYKTKDGIKYTGRRCHPGEDYNCRCIASAILDIENFNVPI